MPQPIKMPCHVEFTGLQTLPQHAVVLGVIVSTSGRLESALGWMLAFFSGGSAAITTAMFHATTSTDAQRAMLLAAARLRISGPELEQFLELMEDFKPRYGERSKLVHNLWGWSPVHPDKAIWCRASDAAGFMAQVAAAVSPEQLPFLTAPALSTRCMLYTVKDLQDVAMRLEEYTNRVNTFLTSLMESHPVLVALANAATNAPQNPALSPETLDSLQTDPSEGPQG